MYGAQMMPNGQMQPATWRNLKKNLGKIEVQKQVVVVFVGPLSLEKTTNNQNDVVLLEVAEIQLETHFGRKMSWKHQEVESSFDYTPGN